MSAVRTRRLYHKLQLAAHRLQKAADRAVAGQAPVTTAQAAVMSVIKRQGGLSQKDIASQLSLHESAVTTMANRLLKLGYITRRPDGADRRVRRLKLTKEGEEVLAAIHAPFGRINTRVERVLSEAEIENLADYLQRLAGEFTDAD